MRGQMNMTCQREMRCKPPQWVNRSDLDMLPPSAPSAPRRFPARPLQARARNGSEIPQGSRPGKRSGRTHGRDAMAVVTLRHFTSPSIGEGGESRTEPSRADIASERGIYGEARRLAWPCCPSEEATEEFGIIHLITSMFP